MVPEHAPIASPASVALPATWRRDIVDAHGDCGRDWLETIPATIAALCER